MQSLPSDVLLLIFESLVRQMTVSYDSAAARGVPVLQLRDLSVVRQLIRVTHVCSHWRSLLSGFHGSVSINNLLWRPAMMAEWGVDDGDPPIDLWIASKSFHLARKRKIYGWIQMLKVLFGLAQHVDPTGAAFFSNIFDEVSHRLFAAPHLDDSLLDCDAFNTISEFFEAVAWVFHKSRTTNTTRHGCNLERLSLL
eukprot:gnl/Spiro4/26650_TR13247_c0_g1_i1.p1 gnl/Spiro4/26650_TR13247_c0_g1~~gnl/Spiro4/26650_TR13247_c0_g1_i1.p1  ORF type:complete len:214 (+),score=13.95 gnl/Spiro4/26650_TR13247_c0_g1_i1:56-643(+)